MMASVRPDRAVALLLVLALVVSVFTVVEATPVGAVPAPVELADPGLPGPRPVEQLDFDLGDEAFTPEGFGASVELRGRVYAPETIADRAPVVLVMHGRHVTCARTGTGDDQRLEWPCSTDFSEIPSYQGYGALGDLLASQGMVVVSIGANGINAADAITADGGASARAQLTLEVLRRMAGWDASAVGSPFGTRFVGHLDLGRVGLMGHSRGGEGVVAAAQLNLATGNRFGIRGVFALAPVDFGRRVLGGVPLGVGLPYCDGDVSDLQGASLYDDARYANPGDPAPKSTFLVHGANHNFFNTVWTTGPGSFDDALFLGGHSSGDPARPGRAAIDPCQPGGSGRLTAVAQEHVGATIMAAFFRRHLVDETSLQAFVTGVAPVPASVAGARWVVAHHAPDRLDIARWSGGENFRTNRAGQTATISGLVPALVCTPGGTSFGEETIEPDQSSPRVTCGGHGSLGVVNDAAVLDVGWVRGGGVIRQPFGGGGRDVTGFDGLRFRVATPDEDRNLIRQRQDLTVVVEDASGHRASVPVAARTNALRRIDDGMVRHAVLGGVRLPLVAFAGIDLAHVRAVELRFDRTPTGRLVIADLAFTAEGTGAASGPVDAGPTAVPAGLPCRATLAIRWACGLAAAAWGREPTADEITVLATGYPTADGRRGMAQAIVGTSAASDVRGIALVERFAEVTPDMDRYRSVLTDRGRRSWEAATVDLIGGFSFASATVGSSARITDAAYLALTGRRPSIDARAYWTKVVDQRGPADLAAALQRSVPARRQIMSDRYQQVLGRAPDQPGATFWLPRLATAGGEQALMAALLATESFRVAAVA